jgi:hypothetical protein
MRSPGGGPGSCPDTGWPRRSGLCAAQSGLGLQCCSVKGINGEQDAFVGTRVSLRRSVWRLHRPRRRSRRLLARRGFRNSYRLAAHSPSAGGANFLEADNTLEMRLPDPRLGVSRQSGMGWHKPTYPKSGS